MNNANGNLVRKVFERARFVRSVGIELISFGDGWCETRIGVVPAHEQQHGLVHAGVLMTLADHTCGGAAATMVPPCQDVITVDNKFSFLRPASGPVLYCRAQVLHAGRRLAFVEADVMAERGDGRMLAVKATST